MARRVDENPVTAADDAFGTTVGSQAIGLYGAEDVRGFSPRETGNLRIEGLYFDQQSYSASNCLVGEQSIKVGLTAQAFDFPSPTGIANYSLRSAAPGNLASVVMSRGPFDAASVEVDGHYGEQGGSLSADACLHRAFNADFDFSRHMQGNDAGLIVRRQLPGDLEVIAFGGISTGDEHKQLPFVYTEGALGVPTFRQMRLPTQDWTHWTWDDRSYGAMLRSMGDGPGSLAAGVFRSAVDNPLNYNDLFLDVAPDRMALHEIDVQPPLHASSTSGEMRALYRTTSGARVDQWAVMVRGRAVDRAFGGDSVTDLGRVSIDDFSPLPQPPLVFTATSDDRVRQFGLGIEYDARWPERGFILTLAADF